MFFVDFLYRYYLRSCHHGKFIYF